MNTITPSDQKFDREYKYRIDIDGEKVDFGVMFNKYNTRIEFYFKDEPNTKIKKTVIRNLSNNDFVSKNFNLKDVFLNKKVTLSNKKTTNVIFDIKNELTPKVTSNAILNFTDTVGFNTDDYNNKGNVINSNKLTAYLYSDKTQKDYYILYIQRVKYSEYNKNTTPKYVVRTAALELKKI